MRQLFDNEDILLDEIQQKEVLPNIPKTRARSILEAFEYIVELAKDSSLDADFFENGKMGEMVDSLRPEDFVPYIEKYLNDRRLTESTSIYNFQYAKKHFMASNVARNIEEILRKYI